MSNFLDKIWFDTIVIWDATLYACMNFIYMEWIFYFWVKKKVINV